MQTSLGNLVSNLKPDDFHNTKKFYSDSQFQLLTREGVYPYDYVQSLKSFFEKQLLPLYHYMKNFCNLIGLEQ